MKNEKDIMKKIKDKEVKLVEIRLKDKKGKINKVKMDIGIVEEEMLVEGVMLEGY